MASPVEHLPNVSDKDIVCLLGTLGYPTCSNIQPLKVTAEYHRIWVLSFAASDAAPQKVPGDAVSEDVSPPTERGELILRVAGNHIPRVKTVNEVAILAWLRSHTSIPVPTILHFDATTANPISREYMIMNRLPGITASDIYDEIPHQNMDGILEQLADYHLQLHRHSFEHLGGLRFEGVSTQDEVDGTVLPGPCVEEVLWQVPDIERHWPKSETFDTLNPTSADGYRTYVDWIRAFVERYIHALRTHESLSWISPEEIALLERFVAEIRKPEMAGKLNDVSLRLAHRDLHFGQILIDKDTHQITGILDWEFAQIVPMPLWRRSFLWSANPQRPYSEREKLFKRWKAIVEKMDGGKEMVKSARWKSDRQEAAWDVCNYLRCVVEVCPRGKQLRDARVWWKEVLKALRKFGIKLPVAK